MTKILCVDDDLGFLQIYQDELTEEGYKVVAARNGKEAMGIVQNENPDLVIMDIRMPTMDGIETLIAMLGRNRQMPVILHTAYPEYQENYMTWGAEAYVIKSSDLAHLKKTIHDVLAGRKSQMKSGQTGKKTIAKKLG
jgi:DNA-binding NtrC family response regulator